MIEQRPPQDKRNINRLGSWSGQLETAIAADEAKKARAEAPEHIQRAVELESAELDYKLGRVNQNETLPQAPAMGNVMATLVNYEEIEKHANGDNALPETIDSDTDDRTPVGV